MATNSWANSNPFPHRDKYKDVPVIESQALLEKLPSVNVVDVRSKYEYETLHIKGAINIPLSSPTFASRVAALIKSSSKPVVFYCNGGTCKKSYKAVKAARKGGVNGTVAYDGGIYNWAQPDPRWILGFTWLAGRIHPQLYPDLDMLAEVRGFFGELYGMDPQTIEEQILPALTGDLDLQ